MTNLKPPADTTLPFFAYGLLKVDAPAHSLLDGLVASVEDSIVAGQLHIRDGLPLLAVGTGPGVKGSLFRFRNGLADEGYRRVSIFEPAEHYMWQRVTVLAEPPATAWALVGVDPLLGSVRSDDVAWRPGPDAAFSEAMDEIRSLIEAHGQTDFGADSPAELRRMFRLQMGYLLLWTVVERYAFLRHGLSKGVEDRVRAVGGDPRLRAALVAAVHEAPMPPASVVNRRLEPVTLLDPDRHSLEYFREVRHHLVHRGKGMADAERLRLSLIALHRAMSELLSMEGLAGA